MENQQAKAFGSPLLIKNKIAVNMNLNNLEDQCLKKFLKFMTTEK